MRILFLLSGQLWVHTLPQGFSDAGHDVKTAACLSQDDLSGELVQFKPHLAVTIGWGREQNKARQLMIRECLKEAGVPHVYWSVEDPAYTSVFTLPLIQRTRPDFIFTICDPKVRYFRKLGFKAAYMDFGFSPHIQYNLDCPKEYDIAVVANAYPDIYEKFPNHYRRHSIEALIKPFIEQNIRVDFWGCDWERMGPVLECAIPSEWIHGPVSYTEANRIYNASNIILGLQNYEEQITQRTYEILGSGGFLLTNDTAGIRKLFTPGEELACSSSAAETPVLAAYYLENLSRRNVVAKRGQECVRNFSYKNKAEYMLTVLRKERII